MTTTKQRLFMKYFDRSENIWANHNLTKQWKVDKVGRGGPKMTKHCKDCGQIVRIDERGNTSGTLTIGCPGVRQ